MDDLLPYPSKYISCSPSDLLPEDIPILLQQYKCLAKLYYSQNTSPSWALNPPKQSPNPNQSTSERRSTRTFNNYRSSPSLSPLSTIILSPNRHEEQSQEPRSNEIHVQQLNNDTEDDEQSQNVIFIDQTKEWDQTHSEESMGKEDEITKIESVEGKYGNTENVENDKNDFIENSEEIQLEKTDINIRHSSNNTWRKIDPLSKERSKEVFHRSRSATQIMKEEKKDQRRESISKPFRTFKASELYVYQDNNSTALSFDAFSSLFENFEIPRNYIARGKSKIIQVGWLLKRKEIYQHLAPIKQWKRWWVVLVVINDSNKYFRLFSNPEQFDCDNYVDLSAVNTVYYHPETVSCVPGSCFSVLLNTNELFTFSAETLRVREIWLAQLSKVLPKKEAIFKGVI